MVKIGNIGLYDRWSSDLARSRGGGSRARTTRARAIWTRISIELAAKVRTLRDRGEEPSFARERDGSGEARRGGGQERWSRVSERARSTPSCSCLPPTACNFLAKALMRGLARHGRSLDDQSRRGWSRCAARPFSQAPPCVSLSPRSFYLVPARSVHPAALTPSPHLSYFLSSSFMCFFPASTADGGGVFTSCAPRGSATVYLNSDLRSDTDSSWPRKYLDAGVSWILFLRGKPRYRGTFSKRRGYKRRRASLIDFHFFLALRDINLYKVWK